MSGNTVEKWEIGVKNIEYINFGHCYSYDRNVSNLPFDEIIQLDTKNVQKISVTIMPSYCKLIELVENV